MVIPATGQVVLVKFPFSDLSQTKLRPAVVLAKANANDWILCQVTSNPYGDIDAQPIDPTQFAIDGLQIKSYVRPGKLFTSHHSLIVNQLGTLHPQVFISVVDAVVKVIKQGGGTRIN